MYKSLLFFFFIPAVISGCSDTIIKKEHLKPGFYELCYSFPKLPENTTENDIKTASAAYEDHLSRNGITVLKRRHTADSACYFTDSIKEISLPGRNLKTISLNICLPHISTANTVLFTEFSRGRGDLKR
jgi:hypothetical protein